MAIGRGPNGPQHEDEEDESEHARVIDVRKLQSQGEWEEDDGPTRPLKRQVQTTSPADEPTGPMDFLPEPPDQVTRTFPRGPAMAPPSLKGGFSTARKPLDPDVGGVALSPSIAIEVARVKAAVEEEGATGMLSDFRMMDVMAGAGEQVARMALAIHPLYSIYRVELDEMTEVLANPQRRIADTRTQWHHDYIDALTANNDYSMAGRLARLEPSIDDELLMITGEALNSRVHEKAQGFKAKLDTFKSKDKQPSALIALAILGARFSAFIESDLDGALHEISAVDHLRNSPEFQDSFLELDLLKAQILRTKATKSKIEEEKAIKRNRGVKKLIPFSSRKNRLEAETHHNEKLNMLRQAIKAIEDGNKTPNVAPEMHMRRKIELVRLLSSLAESLTADDQVGERRSVINLFLSEIDKINELLKDMNLAGNTKGFGEISYKLTGPFERVLRAVEDFVKKNTGNDANLEPMIKGMVCDPKFIDQGRQHAFKVTDLGCEMLEENMRLVEALLERIRSL